MRSKGFLIVVEGIDGSGKTTLAAGLVAALAQAGIPALATREPGATALGTQIRSLVQENKHNIVDRAQYLLFAADRAQHLQELVCPALEKGITVVSDRMGDSSLAYQGFGRGLDKKMIQSVNSWAMGDTTPDLVLYVKIDAYTALQRVKARGKALTSFEQEAMDFWQRVADGYEQIFADRKDVIFLDGTKSPEALLATALAAVTEIHSQFR